MTEKMETKTEEKLNITRRKTTQCIKFCAKEERNASLKKVSIILQKAENERTIEEQQMLCEYSEIVTDLKQRWHRRDEAKRRLEEVEEPLEVIEEKCKILAQAIAQSDHLVVYTGAGISTAARIPDYRGTNGIWTRLQQGKDIGNHDLSLAEPTYTHMALSQLYHKKILKYVVSQNCDGLHLRSGLPRIALSELHGNMYIEVCKNCKPVREYWRLFDVTENTARYSHKTMRRCYVCSKELTDTIVHFGERGTLQWPLNWSGACKNADKADTIICLGSSLKVLKKYPWLWQMNKPAKKRPNLYIVNLQWTPKDDCAVMKINGKCDVIMRQVMKLLGIEIPNYDRDKDPIFAHSTFLCETEMHTTTQPSLKVSEKTEIIEEKEEIKMDTEEQEIKTESVDNEECNFSINSETAQNEAYDLTVSKCSSQNNDLLNNCDINTFKNEISSTNIQENNLLIRKYKSNSLLETCSSKLNTSSVFSIDNILYNNSVYAKKSLELTNIQNTPDYNQLQSAIMAYYLSNLQNPMFNYLLPGLFPYQTSLFYSGLHSIINPVPYINYDFDCSTNEAIKNQFPNNHLLQTETKPIVQQTPTCDFCFKNYKSFMCLFYSRTETVFIKKLYRFSKKENCNKELVCICCDYTTEEDTDSENEISKTKKKLKIQSDDATELNKPIENDNCNLNEDPMKKTDTKIVKIQAGWFGKGYKKNRKLKRKQYSNR